MDIFYELEIDPSHVIGKNLNLCETFMKCLFLQAKLFYNYGSVPPPVRILVNDNSMGVMLMYCTSQIMINKITPSLNNDYLLVEKFDTASFNQPIINLSSQIF